MKTLFEDEPQSDLKPTLQNILKEFGHLTTDLEHLLYPTLLESEGDESIEDLFEEDFETFKVRFQNISRLTALFIKELRKTKIQNHTSLKDKGFIQKLDAEIEKTFEFYEEQMLNANKSRSYISKIQNAFYAYIQLAKVINKTIQEYNETCKDVLPELQNIPEPADLGIHVALEMYFTNWLSNVNELFRS